MAGSIGEALRSQPAQHFTHSNGTEAVALLSDGEEGGTTEMGQDGRWRLAGCEDVGKSGQGRENGVGTVRRGAPHCLPKMTWAKARRARG